MKYALNNRNYRTLYGALGAKLRGQVVDYLLLVYGLPLPTLSEPRLQPEDEPIVQSSNMYLLYCRQ